MKQEFAKHAKACGVLAEVKAHPITHIQSAVVDGGEDRALCVRFALAFQGQC